MTQINQTGTANPTGKDHVFIVSGGRTGTTFFGSFLQDVIKDCTSVHEPDIFYGLTSRSWNNIRTFGLWHMIFGRYLGLRGVRNLMVKRLSRAWDEERLRKSILKHRYKYYCGFDSNLVIEAYGKWGFLLPSLNKTFPEAKFVGIVRDPRDWVRSWVNYGARYDESDPVEKMGIQRMSPAMVGDQTLIPYWDDMSPFAKLCWNWNYTYLQVHKFCKDNQQAKLFGFEKLFSQDPNPMAELLEFCTQFQDRRYDYNVASLREKSSVNSSVKAKETTWQNWSPENARTLEKFCGPLMREFGYGFEPEWQALISNQTREISSNHLKDAG